MLVTGYVPGVPRAQRAETIRQLGGFIRLGALLGRLHTLPVAGLGRPGGAWHHLAEGTPADEISAAARLLEDAADRVPAAERAEFDHLREQVACFDGADGPPEALIHPDFVLANVVATAEPAMVLVDWTGAGPTRRWAATCATSSPNRRSCGGCRRSSGSGRAQQAFRTAAGKLR